MPKSKARCEFPDCRKRAVEGGRYCRAHTPPPEQGEEASPAALQSDGAGRGYHDFYADVLTASEWADLQRCAEAHAPGGAGGTLEEVEVLRTLIRRLMQRFGEDDPARALPLVRQGVDGICRALRTQRLLSGAGADALASAFAVALREIGEEMGIDAAD